MNYHGDKIFVSQEDLKAIRDNIKEVKPLDDKNPNFAAINKRANMVFILGASYEPDSLETEKILKEMYNAYSGVFHLMIEKGYITDIEKDRYFDEYEAFYKDNIYNGKIDPDFQNMVVFMIDLFARKINEASNSKQQIDEELTGLIQGLEKFKQAAVDYRKTNSIKKAKREEERMDKALGLRKSSSKPKKLPVGSSHSAATSSKKLPVGNSTSAATPTVNPDKPEDEKSKRIKKIFNFIKSSVELFNQIDPLFLKPQSFITGEYADLLWFVEIKDNKLYIKNDSLLQLSNENVLYLREIERYSESFYEEQVKKAFNLAKTKGKLRTESQKKPAAVVKEVVQMAVPVPTPEIQEPEVKQPAQQEVKPVQKKTDPRVDELLTTIKSKFSELNISRGDLTDDCQENIKNHVSLTTSYINRNDEGRCAIDEILESIFSSKKEIKDLDVSDLPKDISDLVGVEYPNSFFEYGFQYDKRKSYEAKQPDGGLRIAGASTASSKLKKDTPEVPLKSQ